MDTHLLCRHELLGILHVAASVWPTLMRDPLLAHPLAAMLADADGRVRGAALDHWHALLPRDLPGRLQVRRADAK